MSFGVWLLAAIQFFLSSGRAALGVLWGFVVVGRVASRVCGLVLRRGIRDENGVFGVGAQLIAEILLNITSWGPKYKVLKINRTMLKSVKS